jgi:hypothetical protein
LSVAMPDERVARYREFLKSKIQLDSGCGFHVDLDEINPALKPFNRAGVQWALKGGRRALFYRYGLHKTVSQIEWMRLLGSRVSGLRLITLPLGVRQEFRLDAEQFFTGDYAVRLKFIQSAAEIEDERTIYMTNYETVREGKLDLAKVDAIGLDEADILRGLGGTKTFRELMRAFEFSSAYRLVCTATPSPNEYIELLAYAAFLGVMDVGQAKTRFFKRDSEKADNLTLLPHMERAFWLWVASWALFVQRPSDLGEEFSDEGYELPEIDVRWHEIASDHSNAGEDQYGQGRLLKNAALGVTQAASEKRSSLEPRVAKMLQLRSEDPEAHRIIWHDLEDERRAIEKAVPSVVSVYGTQEEEAKEAAVIGFREGTVAELAGKPVMLGAGCNFQYHCAWEIFLGIGFKFRDAIQAIHRVARFGQEKKVRIDFIYTEAEREIKARFLQKWEQHDAMVEIMTGIIREYGLSEAAMASSLERSMGTARQEASGKDWTLVNNDSVEELGTLEENSVGLVCTSIPFSTQYEYTPSYNDFGHTESNEHFWEQMDFLTPELYRTLMPGRLAVIHVKDRIVPGGLTGLGFQTVYDFSGDCRRHFEKHGFGYLGRKTLVTDVVRENKQTNRLGWSEQCKDGSRMGCGMPEYLMIFRKPQTDRSRGYADVPVVKSKERYTRGRWQFDAHGFMRSSGDRLLQPEDLVGTLPDIAFKLFRAHSHSRVYDFEHDVRLADALDAAKSLPPSFMLLQPQSWHPDVWTDIARMRSLNMRQFQRRQEQHLCPLPYDIVDRVITQYSNEGDLVVDPFAGIGTVPVRCIPLGRRGWGCELNPMYWADGAFYCREEAGKASIPSLFDLIEAEEREGVLA